VTAFQPCGGIIWKRYLASQALSRRAGADGELQNVHLYFQGNIDLDERIPRGVALDRGVERRL
jgi:hypothetical protein